LFNPREIRRLFFEIGIDGFHQYRESWNRPHCTGLFERHNPLDPSVSFLAGSALAAFTPNDAESQGALGAVIGRFHSHDIQEQAAGVHFPNQTPCKPPRFVFPLVMLKDDMDKPGIESAQLPFGRWGMGHMTEAFQLIHGLVAESGDFEVLFFFLEEGGLS
jgi:hypothetical protein